MNHDPTPDDRRFDDAFRSWAGRPPATPARVAATRLAARLPHRTGGRRVWRLAAAAALVLVVVLGFALLSGRLARAPQVAHAVPPMGDDVVVQWLDPETPVYFVLPSSDRSNGGVS